VAYSAHLAGYFYGLAAAALMLAVRAIPRDQFDALALFKRWNQRRAFAAAMSDSGARAQAQYGRVARVAAPQAAASPVEQARRDEVAELRAKIARHLASGEPAEAAALHEKLVSLDPDQVLPAAQQLEVARFYYTSGRYPQAAAAFERYLNRYKMNPEAAEVQLLLGIIHARDLQRLEAAERYLEQALNRVTGSARREQAERWLRTVRESLGRPEPT
jgi:tetratricopeptide (TPR) repeat protein